MIIIIVLGRITFGHIEVADKVFVVIIIIGFYFIKKVICPVRGIHLLVCKIKVVVVGKIILRVVPCYIDLIPITVNFCAVPFVSDIIGHSCNTYTFNAELVAQKLKCPGISFTYGFAVNKNSVGGTDISFCVIVVGSLVIIYAI